jgi:hypothetical protein
MYDGRVRTADANGCRQAPFLLIFESFLTNFAFRVILFSIRHRAPLVPLLIHSLNLSENDQGAGGRPRFKRHRRPFLPLLLATQTLPESRGRERAVR